MIKLYLANLVPPVTVCEHAEAQRSTLDGGLIGKTRQRLQRFVADLWQRQLEAEALRRDMRHLYSMTDAQLRDIGITRMDIPQAVRHGRPGV